MHQILDRFEGSIAAINNKGEVSDIIYLYHVALAEKTSLQFILQEIIVKILPVREGVIPGKKDGGIFSFKLGTGYPAIGPGHGQFGFWMGIHIILFENKTPDQTMVVFVLVPKKHLVGEDIGHINPMPGQLFGKVISVGRAEKLSDPHKFPAGVGSDTHVLVRHRGQLPVFTGAIVNGERPLLFQ